MPKKKIIYGAELAPLLHETNILPFRARCPKMKHDAQQQPSALTILEAYRIISKRSDVSKALQDQSQTKP